MMKANSDRPILEKDHYTGELNVDGTSAKIGFNLSAGADCRLLFEIDPIDLKTLCLVRKADRETGAEFSLNGRSEDGKTITSDSISLQSWKLSNRTMKNHIRVYALSAIVEHPLASPVERSILRLWFRSCKVFHNVNVETRLGTLAIHGDAGDVAIDDMSGSVALQAPSHDPGADWYDQAYGFLRHMQHGLALAHGGRLQTPQLDYVAGSVHRVTFFAGSGFRRELPVQRHLYDGPFIQALASRYERHGPLPDALWTALGWMQIDTSFNETRFLTAMTALETIIESQLPDLRGTTIPKPDFKRLRTAIWSVISADTSLSDDAREIFQKKLPDLNRKTFTDKISALFDHYEIPKRDFDAGVISGLVNLRNEIVHRGAIPGAVDVWPQIILVRELITRILLKEIGFKGEYWCYIGGWHNRDFP